MTNAGLRRLRMVLWGVVAVAGLGVAAAAWGPDLMGRTARSNVEVDPNVAPLGAGDYQLVTSRGEAFTEASLKGQPSLVFFGFTHCPDVCPMTLGEIAGWQKALGEAGKDLRVWLVSVDPERDTPELLADYLSWMPSATGVTGTPAEMDKMLKAFRAYSKRVELEGGDYTLDHSAFVMLFGSDGQFNQLFSWQQGAEQVVPKLKAFLETEG